MKYGQIEDYSIPWYEQLLLKPPGNWLLAAAAYVTIGLMLAAIVVVNTVLDWCQFYGRRE